MDQDVKSRTAKSFPLIVNLSGVGSFACSSLSHNGFRIAAFPTNHGEVKPRRVEENPNFFFDLFNALNRQHNFACLPDRTLLTIRFAV